jgi:hypothetical protein
MPIELGIWKIGSKPEPVTFSGIDLEARLEKLLAQDLSLVGPRLMYLGRQVPTAFGKFIDLLAMDAEGELHVIELKRNRTAREAVAQLLDYACWVKNLSRDDIAKIYAEKNSGKLLEQGFADAFETSLPDEINQGQQFVLVAAELDPSSERIINFLADSYGVPINAVYFRYFKDGPAEYLARTWLIDPMDAEAKTSKSASAKGSETWNGRDFYVALGEGETRNWDDCVKYGFICGGQGRWYSQTLEQLTEGARVFACIPGSGYVGAGIVKEPVQRVKDFKVKHKAKTVSILKAPLQAPNMGKNAGEAKLCEYVVRVEWLKTHPRDQAYWEKGMFANQNTVCKLRNKFTLERLIKHFGLED